MIERTGRRRSAIFSNVLLCYLCFLVFRCSALSSWPSGVVQPDKHAYQIEKQEPLEIEIEISLAPAESTDREISANDRSYDQRRHDSDTFSAMIDALSVMQSHYFHIWPGTWPSAIDWTAAVMSTHISATLSTITESLGYTMIETPKRNTIKVPEMQSHENMINQYFTQIASFYHGENAFSLRTQAYDDMLWVVLGWLESVKFIKLHSQLHYTGPVSDSTSEANTSIWYAQQFIPQFAHRARIFYDLASRGWDTTLCSGGMVWNPYLTPYKNAITNQLFIAASVVMYLYFPGDDNPSPFASAADESVPPAKAHDVRYLENAVKAYDWLKQSNMTNTQGLYIDGFHIRNWRGGQNSSRGTGECDVRDEKVYTYNQGVLLSGLRGLWDATSSFDYLQDGHQLIRNVINATGWENRHDEPIWYRHRWAGMGRNGVMEEACDSSGCCSQNGQTFKGIWWHHFSIFCAPLKRMEHCEIDRNGEEDAIVLHRKSCEGYGEWVKWNANAAQETRNDDGEYGTWWGKHGWAWAHEERTDEGTDYRNRGVPDDEVWRLPEDDSILQGISQPTMAGTQMLEEQTPFSDQQTHDAEHRGGISWDPNDRGRGRTVETQSGGLAVMRALFKWEMWYMNNV